MIGHVLDASGLDAVVAGTISATSWLITAHAASTPLYVPALAVAEVRTFRPSLLGFVAEVLDHPSVLLRDPDPAIHSDLHAIVSATRTYDIGAAHAVVVGRTRGWPVITGDVGRLRRIDPDVAVLLL